MKTLITYLEHVFKAVHVNDFHPALNSLLEIRGEERKKGITEL